MVRMTELPRIHENDHVRIRNDVDPNIYGGWTTMYNEGIIRATRKDKFGLPEVFIEWNKNHWSYNQAPDGWTVEDHFDVIDKQEGKIKMGESEPETELGLFDIVKNQLQSAEPSTEVAPSPSLSPSPKQFESLLEEEDNAEKEVSREDLLKLIEEQLPKAEAFVLIGVARHPHPQSPNGVLVPYAIAHSESEESELLAMTQVAAMTAHGYQELAIAAIAELTTKRQRDASSES